MCVCVRACVRVRACVPVKYGQHVFMWMIPCVCQPLSPHAELLLVFLFFQGDSTPSQWEVEETVRFKELYDQDKDGKLNPQEQLRWVAPNSYGSAREEVRNRYLVLI